MQPLTQPNTSTTIANGRITCINIARSGEPVALRYYGQNASGTASGQAHETQAQAAQDVADWADGKQVAYHKHAELAPNCVADCAAYKAVQ